MRRFKLLIFVVIFCVFIYGFFLGKYKIFPYVLLENTYKSSYFFKENIDPARMGFNFLDIIDIDSNDNLVDKRNNLVRFIWGNDSLDYSVVPVVEEDVRDNDYASLENLLRIDKLTTSAEHGISYISYQFLPVESNGKVLLYHQGHRGDFFHGYKTINTLLSKGYVVVAMSMPLLGKNSQPEIFHRRFGALKINNHDAVEFIKPESGSAVKYFMHGILSVVNYIRMSEYEKIGMIGLSGGGWATMLYAAIDERITNSYPVSAGYPIFLRSILKKSKWGDYEQVTPDLYEIANYFEMYILGSSGKNRSQLLIFNEFDSCCNSGRWSELYEDVVIDKVASLEGGDFEVLIDSTHKEHKISDFALQKILNDYER